MKTYKKNYVIRAPVTEVWNALVDPVAIAKWGAGPAKMSGKTGAKFSLWGGDVYGKNTKVITRKLLEQDWFAGPWDLPSKVSISLKEHIGTTMITLFQTDIPDSEYEGIKDGWTTYYFGPMKELLEK